VNWGRAGCLAVLCGLYAGPVSGQSPEAFRPFEARPYRLVNSIAFAPSGDEMYFTLFAREVRAHRGLDEAGAPEVGLFRSVRDSGGWSEPEEVSLTAGYDSYEPTISPDGSLLVFNSRRPYEDGRVPATNDLWMSERRDGQWTSPRRISELTTFEAEESYGALAGNGTLVFLKDRPREDGTPRFDLFESRFVNGRFTDPTRHPISSDRWGEGDPWLSPDGRTLIFTRWDDEVGWAESVDLYIATLRPEGWSEPVPLTALNTAGPDYGVAGSPDGRWLYYRANSRFMRTPMAPVIEAVRRQGDGARSDSLPVPESR